MGVADISSGFNPEDSRKLWKELEAGKPCCIISSHRRKDGSSFPVEIRFASLTIDNQNLVMALASDITERKQVEDRLRKSEELLMESQAIAGLGSYLLDIPTGRWTSSEMLDHIFGIDETYEHTVETWEALLHPDDRIRMSEYFRDEVVGRGCHFDMEYRIIRPSDHAERWVHGLGRLEFDSQRRPLTMCGTIQDVTVRKLTEQTLQDSEARYRRFAEELPLGIIITQDGLIKYVNKTATQLFGYSEEELVEKPFLPFVCEADRGWLIELHQRRMQGLKVESPYVVGVLRKEGTVRQWQIHTSTIEWNGRLSALGSIADITERREYEQQLRIAATTFESQEGMLVTDAKKIILKVNRSFCNITGYTPEEVIGKSTRILGSGHHVSDFYANMWNKINTTGSWEGDIWDRRKNGELYPAHLTITAVRGDNGALTNYVATYNDITARVQAEEKLLDSLRKLEEKERAKTRFLAAAGHDLRQPIAAATLYLEALKFTQKSQQQKELVERIDHSMNIFSSLLDRLLDISKFDAGLVIPQPKAFHLAELFDWLEKNFSQTARDKQLQLHLFFPANKQLVICTDLVLVQSVLMNLLTNAIKFTAQGKILVSARRRGDRILLQVWDTGIGINLEDIPYIFDEFYQVANFQRNREAGLGLGLSICQRAISLLGSEIACRSHPGRGSVFEFSLPLIEAHTPVDQLSASNALSETTNTTFVSGKKIVVVEDDALVADSLIKLLHELGAEVLYFSNAEEALRNGATKADFYIVDYALGDGLTGTQFLETLQQRHEPIRAVILTGETSSGFISQASGKPWPVLHKPVSYAMLASGLGQ